MRFADWFLLSSACVLCWTPTVQALPSDPGFSETGFFGFGETCTGMAWAPDGSNRLFVTQQDGTVWIVLRGFEPRSERAAVRFATIAPVFNQVESGLIGMTFDPAFQSNHYVYFFVTVSPHEQQIIRYTAEGNVGTEKTVIVAGLPTAGLRHNGGAVGVGPDMKLYWGVGDNNQALGVNLDLASLGAKIGRANLDGSVPNDNPFYDDDGPNADHIWARGVRNPFTMSFEPVTGALWVNVVGELYEQAFVIRRGDHAGYILYENDQPEGYATPLIKYRTNTTDDRVLAANGASRSDDVATFTTAEPHGFRRGEKISISGVADASFNNDVYVTSTPSATTFTAGQPGPDAQSSGGVASTQNLGGCITGGAFYDATQFPPAYRGDYFFGDFNSGIVTRSIVSPPATIERVEVWARYLSQGLVDLEVGPDGALYSLFTTGIIRTAYTPQAQALVLSSTNVWMPRDSERSISVSLAGSIASDVTVIAARVSGDTSIAIAPGTLTFTPSNWNVPQPLTITTTAGATPIASATIEVSSPQLVTESLVVHAVGSEDNALVLSASVLTIAEGLSSNFTVALAEQPKASTTVNVVVSSGSSHVGISAGDVLTFTPANFATPQAVTVDAVDDDVSGHGPVTITLTASGFSSREVSVEVLDNDPFPPVITSFPRLPAGGGVGIEYRYAVTATGVPPPTFALAEAPAEMTIDAATGLITWTPTAPETTSVTVIATNGLPPDATQTFAVQVGGTPICWIDQPLEDATVSGTEVHFSGVGSRVDDSVVPVTRGDFFVDGELVGTVLGPLGTYDFGGAPNGWDTTMYSNGPHILGFRATDAIGQTCEYIQVVVIDNGKDAGVDTDGGVGVDGGAPDAGDNMDGSVGMDAGVFDAGDDMDTGLDTDAAIPPATDAGRDASAPPTSDASSGPGDGGAPTSDAETDATDSASRDAAPSDGGTHAPSADAHRDADVAPRGENDRDRSGCGCRIAGLDGSRGATASAFVIAAVLLLGRRSRARRAGIRSAP